MAHAECLWEAAGLLCSECYHRMPIRQMSGGNDYFHSPQDSPTLASDYTCVAGNIRRKLAKMEGTTIKTQWPDGSTD